MGLEEDLFEAMKFMSFGGKLPQNKMVQALIRNAQVGALKHLRAELDKMIEKLVKQGIDIKDTGNLNPYNILGVKPDATKDEVQKAFREKAAKVHPDKGGSHEDMIRVNAAWEAIQRLKGWK